MIFAIDPGHNYTGVAYLNEYGFGAAQFFTPYEVFDWIDERYSFTASQLSIERCAGSQFVVEDYTHGGLFTKEAKNTLEVLGFFVYGLAREFPSPVKVVNKSRRLPWVTEAKGMIEEEYDQTGAVVKDAVAALAHALAERHLGSA